MDLKRTYAWVLVMALTAFIIYAVLPYVNAFFGAIILYSLFKPLYVSLIERWGIKKNVAAVIVVVYTIFIITLPFLYLTAILINEVRAVFSNIPDITKALNDANNLVPGINLGEILKSELTNVGTLIRDQLLSMLLGVTQTIINITIMYFVLYYMLLNHSSLRKIGVSISPFNENNTMRLAQELSTVTRSTLLSQVAVGILHGFLLAVGFYFFGIPEAVFWGFIGAILSMLPVFGTPMIWVPAGILKIMSGDPWTGAGIFAWGAILSNVDILVRPLIQSKVSRMHPLISIIGFFIGVNFFGILGIVVGPLLLSYFFLMFDMFKEEYLPHGRNTS